jgi:hypothetical protein
MNLRDDDVHAACEAARAQQCWTSIWPRSAVATALIVCSAAAVAADNPTKSVKLTCTLGDPAEA